jgi:hypothetical protein
VLYSPTMGVAHGIPSLATQIRLHIFAKIQHRDLISPGVALVERNRLPEHGSPRSWIEVLSRKLGTLHSRSKQTGTNKTCHTFTSGKSTA